MLFERRKCRVQISAVNSEKSETMAAGCVETGEMPLEMFNEKNLCQKKDTFVVCICTTFDRCNTLEEILNGAFQEVYASFLTENYQFLPISSSSKFS